MKRSKFSLSNYKLGSSSMGELVPVGLHEVLPGDSFQHATSVLLRCSPLVSPVMHPVHVRIHHWFVPHRIIWDGWEDFITAGPDGTDGESGFPVIAMPPSTGASVGSLADYLGVKPGVANLQVSALPFRAYALIWNGWYRDQDLQAELTVSKASGTDTTTSTSLQNVAWEKDYFTSSRPWAQKGPDVTLPLGDTAEVMRTNNAPGMGHLYKGGTNTLATASTAVKTDASSNLVVGTDGVSIDPNGSLYADLSTATAVDVNDVRLAFALQRYEEARARYGSRYVEYLRYLGVRSSDARLQRPEYLGGGKQTIQFSEVLQTGPDSGGGGVANLLGHGISAMRSNRYRRFFEEHGYVISMMSVKPKSIYVDGLPRTWNRRTKEDFWQQELQHIGQQEVLNKEVYAAHSSPNGTFGFQDRYDEYRRQESSISGEFRTTYDDWHFGRSFASDPSLNAAFVKCVPSVEPFANQTDDTLLWMAMHSLQARRLVARSGSSFIF